MLLGILEISRLAHPHWLVGDDPLIYRPTLLGVNNRFVNKSVSSVCDTIPSHTTIWVQSLQTAIPPVPSTYVEPIHALRPFRAVN